MAGHNNGSKVSSLESFLENRATAAGAGSLEAYPQGSRLVAAKPPEERKTAVDHRLDRDTYGCGHPSIVPGVDHAQWG